MVIIDTPPMQEMPDARVLGRLADGVILVTRAGHTTRDAAIAANERFCEDRTRVLGTVLNDWLGADARSATRAPRYPLLCTLTGQVLQKRPVNESRNQHLGPATDQVL